MISLERSNRIIEAIFARGRELACRPLSAIVVEPGAKVKAFQKQDDSSMMRFEMAYGKAYAALALGLIFVASPRPHRRTAAVHAVSDARLRRSNLS